MAVQLDRDSTLEVNGRLPASNLEDSVSIAAVAASRGAGTKVRKSAIWVVYERHQRRFIDKIDLPGKSEMKLQGLRAWWNNLSPRGERLAQRVIFCKRPYVAIGSLPQVGP